MSREINTKTEDGNNYILKVRRPDGLEISILVPVESNGYFDTCLKERDIPFGLNFVTSGHYC